MLQLKNKQLHSKLEAMEHMQGDEDSESKKKMAGRIQEVKEQCDATQSFTQTLFIKERKANGIVSGAGTPQEINWMGCKRYIWCSISL